MVSRTPTVTAALRGHMLSERQLQGRKLTEISSDRALHEVEGQWVPVPGAARWFRCACGASTDLDDLGAARDWWQRHVDAVVLAQNPGCSDGQ